MAMLPRVTKGYGSINSSRDEVKWEDSVKKWKWEPIKKFHAIRAVGNVLPVTQMWVHTKPDDENSKKFPIWDPSFNSDTETFESGINPLRDDFGIKSRIMYLGNFIIRDIQASKPASLSPDWTPIRAIFLPKKCVIDFQEIITLNSGYDVSDPDFGCDIFSKYDPDQDGIAKYSNQKGERTPLTPEERGFELYDFISIYKPNDPAKIKADITRLGYYKGSSNVVSVGINVNDKYTDDEDKTSTSADQPPKNFNSSVRDTVIPPPPVATAVATPVVSQPIAEQKQETVQPQVQNAAVSAPVSAPVVQQEPVQQASVQSVSQPKPTDCPTDFGKYAKRAPCFRCSVRKDCINAGNN